LVFSTLHTNNAATCLPRLLNMGVEPFLIASTVRVVLGQRLVRRLCSVCRESFAPDAAILERLDKAFHLRETGIFKQLHAFEQSAANDGIGKPTNPKAKANDEMSTSETAIVRLYKAHEDGCESCNHTGYKGRIGIYEVLDNTETIQRLIVTNSTSEAIQQQAIKDGMLTMQLDGFVKALRGETTIEEVLRVTAEE
jgi:type IV pilus assembly protein PilB